MVNKKRDSFLLSNKGVLITGASSGIGFSIAKFLAEKGFTVFGTVRKESDAEKLKSLKIPELVPVCPLDLTEPSHIKHSLEFVSEELKRKGKELYGIINNAGGGFIGPIELMDLEKLKIEIETRILGHLRLLQAFLPMIREAHGRIIWITTPSLLPIPYVSSIHACDFAVNCLARTLKIELSPWKIHVIMIRCGRIRTPAVEKSYKELEKFLENLPENSVSQIYSSILKNEMEELKKFDKNRTEPFEVARVVFNALTSKSPASRYKVGYRVGLASFLEFFPQAIVDFVMMKRAKTSTSIPHRDSD